MEHFGADVSELINVEFVFKDQLIKEFLEIMIQQLIRKQYFPNLSKLKFISK
jgi:hypothetical protein